MEYPDALIKKTISLRVIIIEAEMAWACHGEQSVRCNSLFMQKLMTKTPCATFYICLKLFGIILFIIAENNFYSKNIYCFF